MKEKTLTRIVKLINTMLKLINTMLIGGFVSLGTLFGVYVASNNLILSGLCSGLVTVGLVITMYGGDIK